MISMKFDVESEPGKGYLYKLLYISLVINFKSI